MDEHIEVTHVLGDLVEEPLDLVPFGDVDLEDARLASERLDSSRSLLRGAPIPKM